MATEKFKALTHFIIEACRDNPASLGATRLNKALWLADVMSYQQTGESVTGDTYVKRPKGPVPAHILATLRELKRNNDIAIEEPVFQFDPRLFIAKTEAPTDALTPSDLRLARSALDHVRGRTANMVSEETHDVVWEAATEGEPIPLAATLVSEAGEITPQVVEWAYKHLGWTGDDSATAA